MLADESGRSGPIVAVIGGGITGLATAYFLQRNQPGARVLVYERQARLGGNIQTERDQGFVFDAGPDSFLRTKPWALELSQELHLESELITAQKESRAVYLAHAGKLERMPEGMVLGIPTRVQPIFTARFMSLPAKLRMLSELLLPRGFGRASSDDGNADESIARFISRRFGEEAGTALATPLLAGIYAGAAESLSIQSTFPHLVELEARYGSVIRGMIQTQLEPSERRNTQTVSARMSEARAWLKKPAPHSGQSPFVSFRTGMGTLIQALRQRLDESSLRVGVEVKGIERGTNERGTGWSLFTSEGRVEVDAVVLATPAHVASRLVPRSPLAEELAAIPYTSTATVFFGVEQRNLRRPLDGAGFIVPPGEGGLLAGTWISSKWEGRAPPGTALVRAFLGGVQSNIDVTRESNATLLEIARLECERLMGPLGPARVTRVFRHARANPQPVVGHGARLRRIERRLKEHPGLYLAGSGYDGVSISDCVRQARATVSRIVADMTNVMS